MPERVSVRRSNDRRVEQSRQREIVEVAAGADDEARVFLALDSRAERHARPARWASRCDCNFGSAYVMRSGFARPSITCM